LGGPKEIPVSDKRTNPKGGISFGGAKKAERQREQGAVEAECAQEDQGQERGIDPHQKELLK
jgi:hypothetical protein